MHIQFEQAWPQKYPPRVKYEVSLVGWSSSDCYVGSHGFKHLLKSWSCSGKYQVKHLLVGIDIDHIHWIAKLAYNELTLTLFLFVLLFSAFRIQV